MEPPVHQLKVVFLGGTGVGKTSILNQLLTSSFTPMVPSTIGASSVRKTFQTACGPVHLDLWDTAGQERYRSLAPAYYQGSDVAVIVFSLDDAATLNEALDWVDELKETLQKVPALYLVGNKLDLDKRDVTSEEGSLTADRIEARYFETSAKNGANVQELFGDIAATVERPRPMDAADQVVAIESAPPPKKWFC
jgi:small GTP-binding protein